MNDSYQKLKEAAQAALDAWDKFDPEADLGVALSSIDAINNLRVAISAAKQEQPQCRRYMDDFPGARADCEYQIAKGKRCSDCPKQEQQAEPANLFGREGDKL